jgi:hypothetical protein
MDIGLVYSGFLLKRYPMNRFVLRQNIPMSDDKKLVSVCCSDAGSFSENLVRNHLRSGLSTLEDWSIFLLSILTLAEIRAGDPVIKINFPRVVSDL